MAFLRKLFEKRTAVLNLTPEMKADEWGRVRVGTGKLDTPEGGWEAGNAYLLLDILHRGGFIPQLHQFFDLDHSRICGAREYQRKGIDIRIPERGGSRLPSWNTKQTDRDDSATHFQDPFRPTARCCPDVTGPELRISQVSEIPKIQEILEFRGSHEGFHRRVIVHDRRWQFHLGQERTQQPGALQ